jgi:hypothetical protein
MGTGADYLQESGNPNWMIRPSRRARESTKEPPKFCVLPALALISALHEEKFKVRHYRRGQELVSFYQIT